MGGLAALAREAGHTVTGCDVGVYPPMSDQLRALGIELIEGYDADQIKLGADMYVVGNVVSRARLADGSPKFPLMEAILDAGLPYSSGPAWLAEHILASRHVLAVAGTHGKTTTSSMLAWILEYAGLTPGFLIGGVPLNFGVSARLGQIAQNQSRPLFVIEADEYDTAFFDKRSKFVHYRPRTVVLNNLEYDHADIFPNLAAIEQQFHHLLRTVPAAGRVVVNAADEALARVLAQGCWSARTRFGSAALAAACEFAAQGPANNFEILQNGAASGARLRWDLGGTHNQMNALAAIAAAADVGVPLQQSVQALSEFQNVRRRMELRGRVLCQNGLLWVNTPDQELEIPMQRGAVEVFDDFAHHPTAIATTLQGLRAQIGPARRILAVFEPRSNTMKLGTMAAQLPAALAEADLAFCHTAGLEWDAAAALAPLGEAAICASDIDALIAAILLRLRSGDAIVCMSNGGFGNIHLRLLRAMSTQFRAQPMRF